MNMALEMICPVCNKTARGRFCEHCGYELHLLPADVGKEVTLYEQERAEHYRARLDKFDESMKREEELSRQVEVKDKELADLTKRFTELDAALQDALKQRDEMSSIAASRIPISFLVMMQSDKVTSIFGLFEGENVFGNQLICSARVADPHFSVRALTHQDSKGRARTKFYVSPLKGRIYRSAQNANEIIGETEMEKTDSIYIDNVRFTLVANINK